MPKPKIRKVPLSPQTLQLIVRTGVPAVEKVIHGTLYRLDGAVVHMNHHSIGKNGRKVTRKECYLRVSKVTQVNHMA